MFGMRDSFGTHNVCAIVGTGTIYHQNECDKKAPSSDEAF